MLPLANVRVVDLTWWMAGPHATLQLAMMGADVIRVESLRRMDSARNTTPYAEGVPGHNRSGRWISHNFSKRSLNLDLGTPEGNAVALKLVAKSDMVIENFSAGTLERLGLGYDELRAVKPDIILASVSALGKTGPFKSYLGMGPSITAYSGLGMTVGDDGTPGAIEPFLPDYTCALHVVSAVLAALHDRKRTGKGTHIDMSMCEAQMSMLPEAFIDLTVNNRVRRGSSSGHPTMAPHGYFPCEGRDRWISIAVASDSQWQALCEVLGAADLAADARFSDALSRHQHQEEVNNAIGQRTGSRDAFELQEALQARNVPAGVCLTAGQAFESAHFDAQGIFGTQEHAEAGAHRMMTLPWKLSASPAHVAPAPLLGEHTEAVLRDVLDLTSEEIDGLRERKVVVV